MAYTINQIAKMANISTRALRYYDEIDLLTPAYIADNGYRYYEKEQVVILQQILLFREIGFSLEKIKEIITSDNSKRLDTLIRHRELLENKIERFKGLIQTVDITIKDIKGETSLMDKDYFKGFKEEKQEQYEKEIEQSYGDTGKKLVEESRRIYKKMSDNDMDNWKEQAHQNYLELAELIEAGSNEADEAVQIIIERHYQSIKRFYTPSKEVFIGLGDLYVTHEDFKKTYEEYHPKMAEFLKVAMKIYAEEKL